MCGFLKIMDSIAQWMKALPTLPEVCSSWHLQGATIPVGANVRVDLFSPLSEIKTSFVAFHFRCLIQLDHLHSIRSIDLLTKGSYLYTSSCHVPTGSCLIIKVHQNQFYNHYGQSSGQPRVISIIRSRVSQVVSSRCPIKPVGQREVLNKLSFHIFSSSYCWTMTFLQSPILKKIHHFIFVIKFHVIFKRFSVVNSPSMAMVTLCQYMLSYLQEIRRKFEKTEVVLNAKSVKVENITKEIFKNPREKSMLEFEGMKI